MGWFAGRRFWIVLLVVSLGVNGVLAGILAQRALTPAAPVQETGRYMPGSGGFNPRAFIAALPEDRQEAARVQLREGLRGMRPLFGEMMASRREMNRLLRAEEFDEAAMLAAMAQMRATRARLDASGEAIILDIVADLDPDTRRAALEAAYSPRRGPMFRRGGPRGEHRNGDHRPESQEGGEPRR